MRWSQESEASQRLAGAADLAAIGRVAGELLSVAEGRPRRTKSCANRCGRCRRTKRRTRRSERCGAYALKHPGIRHRELAWRMVDEEVAYLSPSTVYRILKAENLVCPWRRRTKRTREDEEKATRPDEIWATDLMYVHHRRTDVLLGELPGRVLAADRASCARAEHGWDDGERGGASGDRTVAPGERRRASGRRACRECAATTGVATSHGSSAGCWTNIILGHQRIKPHCPEENGIIERSNRTLREALDGQELTDLLQARDVIAGIIRWYNDGAITFSAGLPATDRLLPGRPGQALRTAAPKDGRGAASATREEPKVAAADAAAGIPGGRC